MHTTGGLRSFAEWISCGQQDTEPALKHMPFIQPFNTEAGNSAFPTTQLWLELCFFLQRELFLFFAL